MTSDECAEQMARDVNRMEDYATVIEKLVKMHPLKAAVVTALLFNRLNEYDKVNLHKALQESLKRNFVVEKHSLSVREFPNAAAAKRWVDMNNGARLVEGEK